MSPENDASELIAVVQFFRHGHRTPAYRYPNDPYGEDYWPLEMGVLTNKGIKEMYELGKFTRERYKNFLPNLFPNKNFLVYTTEQPRTIQSAQAFSAGLYPPPKDLIWNENIPWTPIPTYMAEEYLFRADIRKFAPAYAKDFASAMGEFLEKYMNSPNGEIVAAGSGIKEFKDYVTLVLLFDTLSVQESLGLKLPDWTKSVYPNENIILDCLESVAKTEKMKTLFLGPALYEIIRYFEKMKADPTSGPKLMAFSGHDINIVGILEIFGAFKRHRPSNSASVFIELRKKNKEFFVNVFHKQENVVPVKVREADFNCTFENFKSLFKDYAISKEEFYKECGKID